MGNALLAPIILFTTIQGCFILGMYDGGASDELIDHFVEIVIPCENSRWEVDAVNEQSGALGLAQFLPSTWNNVSERTGFDDWANSYHQGYNVATWSEIVDPSGTGGWNDCW
jgi:hypothetical protein